MGGTEIASMYATIDADISNFKKGMGQVSTSITSIGGQLQTLSGGIHKMQMAAGAAVVGGVALFTGAIVETTKEAGDMQQAIANIAADMGLTAEETKKTADLINDLGIDPKLKVSAEEASDAIHMLGKNGLDLDQIMKGAARSTVLLANSTDADFATAADIATDVMAQFKIKAEDMMTAVNGITGTTRFSKFGIEDYKLALAQAGGVAATVGVDFADFNATIAAISPLFASGSDAGTSFKTFLQRLVPSTKPATKAMKELGIITADGQNQFFTASGQMKSMAEIAQVLQDAFIGLTEEQKNSYASTIFGTDAMRAAFAIADAGGATINDLKAKIGNTDAEESAATRMNTLNGVMEIFWGIIDSLKVQIGNAFLPVAQRLGNTLVQLASDNGPTIVAFFQSFAEQLEAVINYFIAVVEDGDTMNDWLTKMSPTLQDVVLGVVDFATQLSVLIPQIIEGATSVFKFINQFVDLNDILNIVRIVLLSSALASLISFISGIVTAISTITSLVGGIGTMISALGGMVAAFNPVILIVAAVGAAIYGLYKAWTTNFLGIQDITYSVLEKAKTWISGFIPSLESAKNSFKEWGTSAFNKISEGFNASKEFVKNQLTIVMNDVKEHGWNYALGAFAGRLYEGAKTAFIKFGEGLKSTSPNIANDLTSAFQGVVNVFDQIIENFKTHVWNSMTDVGSRIADGLVNGLYGGYSRIQSAISFLTSSIPQWVKDQLGIHSPSKVFQEIGLNIMAGLDKGISDNIKLPKMSIDTAMNHIFTPIIDTTSSENTDIGYSAKSSNSRIDVYVHANSTMPTDRESIRQLARDLQREFSFNGARVVMP